MSTPSSIFRNQQGVPHASANTPRDSIDSDSTAAANAKHVFKSYRLVGEYEKPWLSNKAMKATRWNDLIVGILILLGLIGAAVIGFFTVYPYVQPDVSSILSSP